MTKTKTIVQVVICLLIVGCKTEEHKFPIEKRFWSIEDYEKVTLELNYGYENDEKLPSLDDPTTRIIVEKLTDHQNYKVVLDDEELGLKHRNGVASGFFKQWKEMHDIYQSRDVQDNYLYGREMLKVWHFGLGLQLKYFKLGNDEILASSDDPNSSQVKNNLNSNVNTLISNFNIYLDEINDENAFSEDGQKLLAKGIDAYFTELVELNPNANFAPLERKIDLMLKKSKSDAIKTALTKVKELIKSKKQTV